MTDSNPTQEEIDKMSPEQIAELQKKNCVFCRIIAGEVPSHKVYEDDLMLALMDIYPATKGHVLLMPKEHVPIMPLMQPDVFKHLFSKLKFICRGVREGTPSTKCTVFIANGGVAGQQSPHFLFHVIPRDDGDGLDNFIVPSNDVNQDDLLEPFKANITKMMQSQLQKDGKMLVQPPGKEELAKILEQNPQLKDLLINNPGKIKQEMDSNPQLKALFQGIDIDKLSESLKGISKDSTGKSVSSEDKKVSTDLKKVLDDNHALKNIVMHEPERLKEEIKMSEKLRALFEGYDIDELSETLRDIEEAKEKLQKIESMQSNIEIGKEEMIPEVDAPPRPSQTGKDPIREPLEEESDKTDENASDGESHEEEPVKEKKDDLMDRISEMFSK